MEGPVERQLQPKDIVLYVPMSIEEGEYTYFTQLIELSPNTMFLEMSFRAKLTPTKMFLETLCYIVVTRNYQTIHREQVYPIGAPLHFSKEIPGVGTVGYTTQHVPYVGLILTRLKTFK